VRLHRWVVAAWSLALSLLSASVCALPDGLMLTHGDVREEQGTLVAQDEGGVLEHEGGMVLRLEPGAVVRSFGRTELWLAQGGKQAVYLLQLETGHAELSVRGNVEGALPAVVRTKHKLVGVVLDGTVGVDVRFASAMLALDGRVLVGGRAGWEPLSRGRIVTRAGSDKQKSSRAVASAPRFQSLRRVWSGVRGPVHVGGFEWSAIPRARGYELLLTDRFTGKLVHRVNPLRTRLDWRALELVPGSYELSVRGFDEFGFPGEWSHPEAMAVIGFIPDDETYRDESGVIRVGSQRTAKFSNTEGLEVTYGSAGPWVSAPPVLFFRQTSRTVVRFRYPGADGIVAVPVEHQQVQATIEIGPQRAVWPRDAVQVTVRLSDAVGGQAASMLHPKIDVTLGVEALDLEWTRNANVLQATIPARSGPGPWVIRVNVLHPSGKQLDRNLLEIVSDSRRQRRRIARGVEAPARIAHNDSAR